MHLENLKNISKVSNDTINFNTKVIDIDFYNVTNRNLFLGHEGDNYLYAIHLIIPNLEDIRSSEGGDNSSLSVRMAYQSKDMEEARTINGAMSDDGQYYFLIPNTITSKVGSGFIQFEISKISESSSGGDSTESSVKKVVAKSKRIPYIIEESLEVGSEDEEIIKESSSKIEDIFSLLNTLSSVKADKDKVYTKSEAMERFTKRIYAHETYDTYSDDGVYIDEATDLDTWYIIKNSNNARVGILFCAAIPNSTYGKTQIALYYSGGFKYRYKHSNGGSWDEWENIARDSTVFDAVVRNYKDVTPDITFDIHNTAIATYLTESAVYSPNDYNVTKVPTSLSGTPYDTPNTTTIDLPTGSSKVILYDTVAKTEQVIFVSGSTYTITNLIPNRVYAYTVRNSSGTMLSYGTVKATGHIRMIDGGGNTFNIRDLGGWTCDGGKTKYGLIYRGAELNGAVSLSSSQVDFFKNVLGIRDEIDLRNPTDTGVGSGALGLGVDYVNIYTNYSPYALQDSYRQKRVDIIKRIAKNIKEKKVTYIHCSAGADRTAIICTFIEAICGVSQNDIDRDYELTAFAYDTKNNRLSTRTRKNTWANGHRVMINGNGTESYSFPYINNMEGTSFQDKIVRFLLRSGVTIDEINAIRFGLIDGNPTKLLNPYSSVTITNTLTNVSNTNTSSSVVKYQPYEAELKVNNMYKITSITITMGGVDVTQQYYDNGKINIPIVTGNLVISAEATQSSIISEDSFPLISVKRTSTDLNSEQINSICTVLGTTANRPDGVVGICLTLGTTRAGGIIAQLVLSATSKIYLRYKAGNNSSYTDWTEISSVQETNTAIANAITGLVKESSLPLMSTLKTSTDLNSEQINSICTVSGTTANRPEGVFGICLTLGTTRGGGVIAQLILSTTSKIYLRYKAGNGAVYGDWKECASAQELEQLRDESAQELEQFREELVNEGTNLLYLPNGTFEQSGTGNIKAVIKDQVITLSGTANGSAAYVNIPISVNMEAKTYTLKRFLDDAKFAVMLTKDTSSTGISTVSKGDATQPNYNTVTLSTSVTAKYIRIYIPASVPEGTSLSSVFRLELKKSSTAPNAWESPVLLKEFLMPGLPLMSTFKISTDLDSEQINRLATVTSATQNRPSGVFGICLTLGVSSSSNVRAQLILSTASKIYLRYNSGSGYGEWSEIGAGQDGQPEIKVPSAIDAFGIFDTVGFIGDSLGSGYADANGAITQYNDPPSGMNDYDVSWVQFMCRKTGRTGYQFSTGGQTTKGWLSTSAGNPTGINMLTDGHHKCQAYIIGLGVNDARQNAVPLGASTDIGGNNNNSFYRNYAKIISTIQETAPKAPIFCITIPKANSTNGSYDNVEAYSGAIKEVAALYNSVYVIEPSVSKVNELFALYKDVYHYSALGYARIAEYMLELLNACVEEHKDDFKQLNLLESDPKEYYTKAEVDAIIESLRNELTNQ